MTFVEAKTYVMHSRTLLFLNSSRLIDKLADE
jgi:hypothetical protein